MTDSLRRITDPQRIRALTHPVRLELLDHLWEVKEATATECADAVGQSVASCSFHLRTLEKHGYIERAERRGREKPWRAVLQGWDMPLVPELPGSVRAVTELGALQVAREGERVHRYLTRADQEPVEWVEAATVTSSSFWATAAEMMQLSRDIQHLADRFDGRSEDPAQRPVGARLSRMFATVNPDPARDHFSTPENGDADGDD